MWVSTLCFEYVLRRNGAVMLPALEH